MVGDGEGVWSQASIDEGLAYIQDNAQIREVILSGGDPLILSERRLGYILSGVKRAPHVRRVRFDTKIFTMVPQRITDDLVNLLREYMPCFLIGHFTHPYELSVEAETACARLIDRGIPVFAHTPLLQGVNDDEITLVTLFEKLVDLRIKPYYLIHFIPTKWTEHFRVSIDRGLHLIKHIQAHCDGLAVPMYIAYLPQAGGKVPITPQYMVASSSDGIFFQSFDGRTILYPEQER
jgi:lysine 2,3-aminomutase